MAEDNMEISYDDHGDDDIDINIDIDQDNHDDDYMIEDADSEAGTNDDVMVDEDNTSFAMEDDDYMPDHTIEDVQPEPEIVEVTEIEMTKITETEAEQTIDNPFAPSGSSKPEDTELQEVAANQTVETAAPVSQQVNLLDQSVLPVTTPGFVNDHPEEPPASPKESTGSQEVLETNVAPPSPPKSSEHEQLDSAVEDSSVHPAPEQELATEERIIMVHYNDQEYAMVSSSEFDDPETYFLRDSAALKEPLSIFFACVRETLGDEINPEDELCLSIDDLGLETFETCLSNNDVTFAQLVNVHTTLLRNDGQNEMPPLYITLNTKPEFGRTLEKMIQDANTGLGLNEIMESWVGDEGTDWAGSEHGLDGGTSGGDDDYYDEKENDGDVQVPQDESEETAEMHEHEHSKEQLAVTQAHEKGGTGHITGRSEGAAEPTASDDAQAPSKEEQRTKPQSTGQETTLTEVVAAPSVEAEEPSGDHGNVHDEEEDLIDYEDDDYSPAMIQAKAASRRASNSEEDLSSPCLRPASCFCSSCNKRLLAEYAEINEKLDQSRRSSRSSSRTLEESNGDTSGKPVTVPEEDTDTAAAQHGQDTSSTANVEADQNEYSGEYAEEDQQEIDQEGYEEVDEAAHTEEDGNYTHEEYTNYEEEPSERELVEGQIRQPETTYDTVEQLTADQQAAGQSGQQETTATNNRTEQQAEATTTQDEDEISYEDDEAPQADEEPAAVVDEKQPIHVVESSLQGDHEDEIDYDDDDRAEAHTTESESVDAAIQPATGKRPHDEPDILDVNGQDAKRVCA